MNFFFITQLLIRIYYLFQKKIGITNPPNTYTKHFPLSENDQVNCLRLLNKEYLASGHLNHVKIWNVTTMECLHTLDSHRGWITCLEEGLPAESRLISGSADYKIKIWGYLSGRLVRTLNEHEDHHTDKIICLKLLPLNRLASGSCDKNICIWADTGTQIFQVFEFGFGCRTPKPKPKPKKPRKPKNPTQTQTQKT